MSERFDGFFKDLASGISRRAALRRLFGGMIGAAALIFTGRTAGATSSNPCYDFCTQTYSGSGPGFVQECLGRSVACPPGQCAYNINCSYYPPSGPQSCSDGNQGDWVCVPVA
jgi:hypothetical protein